MRAPEYRFGPFRIDATSRLLFRGDERVILSPKALDLLNVLVQREGVLLEKDELLRLVWPETVVEEGNLSKNIFLLRKTLGNNQHGQPYIETVPKRGYRFVGPLQQPEPELPDSIEYEEHTREQVTLDKTTGSAQFSGWLVLTAAVALIACTAAWILWGRRPADAAVPRAILVLPLANLSGNPSDDYFSDGLTEEVISTLSGTMDLRVVPRSTAFQFKGKASDVREAGRRLEVDAVLEGGVRRDPDQMRVSLRLIRVSDGSTFWSQTLSRPTSSTIATQQEIAQAVLAGLNRDRTPPPPNYGGTNNLEAYNAVLRARFAYNAPLEGGNDRALALYQRAAELDPNYAEAWAGQAACYANAGYVFLHPPEEMFAQAMKAASRALAIDPMSVTAHVELGRYRLYYVHDWATARKEFDFALGLNPSDPHALHESSHFWVVLGRMDLAEAEGKRGLQIDPLSETQGSHSVWLSNMAGQYEESVTRARDFLQFLPTSKPTLWYNINALERLNRMAEALELRRRVGQEPPKVAELVDAAATGDRQLYLKRVSMQSDRPEGRPATAATDYAWAGNREGMYHALERGLAQHDAWMVYLNVQPDYAPYRQELRFQKLVAAMQLDKTADIAAHAHR